MIINSITIFTRVTGFGMSTASASRASSPGQTVYEFDIDAPTDGNSQLLEGTICIDGALFTQPIIKSRVVEVTHEMLLGTGFSLVNINQ